MHDTQATARRAGMLYLLTLILTPFGRGDFFGRLLVQGDSAATARNIEAAAVPLRLGILGGLLWVVLFLLLAWSLYKLLRDVALPHARVMLGLVGVSVTVGLVTLLVQAAPLILLSRAGLWSPFSPPQLEALAYGFLTLRGIASAAFVTFWGLWLLPFGLLVVRSGFIPRTLGVLLLVACAACLTTGAVGLLWPAGVHVVDKAMLPLHGIGELSMIGWLLVRGVKAPPLAARPSYAA